MQQSQSVSKSLLDEPAKHDKSVSTHLSCLFGIYILTCMVQSHALNFLYAYNEERKEERKSQDCQEKRKKKDQLTHAMACRLSIFQVNQGSIYVNSSSSKLIGC